MTKILLEDPSIFFYSLLEQSSKAYKVKLDDEVKTYLIHFLVNCISDSTRLDLESPLSLRYLTAVEENDYKSLRVVGDSCLFILGMLPTGRPEYSDLYRDLGCASYDELANSKRIFGVLSSSFSQTIDVLHGVNILLERNTPYEIWNATGSRIAKAALLEQNVIPLRRRK